MEPNQTINQKPKGNAKDFFLNLGAIIALGMTAGYLLNLLFTIINKAYPSITPSYSYYGSYSISWPVATLIIFFPVYILLMWLLEKGYRVEPERRNVGVRKWLTYLTLFFAGLTVAGDLVTVIYYFIDGQELTTGFLMKVAVVLVIAVAIFFYYISDVMGKLNSMSRKVWAGASFVVILGCIIWGFSVLGSPRTQQLIKYDEQKVNDLQNINNAVTSYYSTKGTLPKTLNDLGGGNYYITQVDAQTQKSYEYQTTGVVTYNLCADFNKATPDYGKPNMYMRPIGYISWTHPAGHYCFEQTINPNTYTKGAPVPANL